jgi:large subunit ribosomal protein L15
MKIKKTKKSKKQRGNTTHGHGARKKWKGKGHHGGKGMAGTGKRADQKKTLVTKLYGNKYFGRKGITSKKTQKLKIKKINLGDIQSNLESLLKKNQKEGFLELKEYKVLGKGELKDKIKIKAKSFSQSAKKKIEEIGGEAVSFKRNAEEKNSIKE